MSALLAFSRMVDRISDACGWLATRCVLIACLISAGNAFSRYLFDLSSNAWLEVQWYLFSGIFLLGAARALRLNEHVRVDLVYMFLSDRARLWIDALGAILFLMPATVILAYMSWLFFEQSWYLQEISGNAGGLIRWPVKLLMPIGFALLALQGLSEIVKRGAALLGKVEIDTHYERPLQ